MEYRVTFSVQSRPDDSADFEEIGFGSSFDNSSFDACAYDVETLLSRRVWETTGDMPDPQTTNPSQSESGEA